MEFKREKEEEEEKEKDEEQEEVEEYDPGSIEAVFELMASTINRIIEYFTNEINK